ncbi:MAG TPA: AAA family ATPase [Candidatus Eisenbacteria bacterium]|nr:AAA family ATPase [Candidatus Eisenbacteria bacterium]
MTPPADTGDQARGKARDEANGEANGENEGGDVLVLPAPSLVLLIGAAGSGKSTFAARHFPAEEVLSADRYRGLVAGDEGDQRATRTAFALLHREVERRLAGGRSSVVDATNVTAFARRSLLRRSSRYGVPAVALVFDLDPLLVMTRNATRAGRSVPTVAVEQQLRDLARSLRGNLAGEGFAVVRVFRDAAEVEGVRVSLGVT